MRKIYKSAMAMAGVDVGDCIAVGDSLHHDIKGANIAGIQSAFITGGIHASELGLGNYGELADSSSVQALALKYDAHPSFVLPAFMWYVLKSGEIMMIFMREACGEKIIDGICEH
ncbi:unnamed protein product [Camellia sinensis]